jgi:polyhydroxybutyrate depolymerase
MACLVLRSLLKAFLALALAVTLLALIAPSWAGAQEDETLPFDGRAIIVHAPARLPASGSRALVIVLHGGLGNAARIADSRSEKGINLDAQAEHGGFVVAYLNGTPVTRLLGGNYLGWNAGGGCCDVPAVKNLDDVAYIEGAVMFLAAHYGIDAHRVYGIGHSNGAMMVQRLACESDVLAAAVALSGPLNLDVASCAHGKGKRVLAIHGADDRNVPLKGGKGRGLAGVAFQSEAHAGAIFAASGASYTLDVVDGADHFLDHIDAAMQKREGVSIADKAISFFGLD